MAGVAWQAWFHTDKKKKSFCKLNGRRVLYDVGTEDTGIWATPAADHCVDECRCAMGFPAYGFPCHHSLRFVDSCVL